MTVSRLPRARSHHVVVAALAVLLIACAAVVAVSRPTGSAEAQSGPCGTSHDGLTGEEQEFLQHFANWRQSKGLHSSLTVSAPLNRAAAWFAQHLVDGHVFGGHMDTYGRNWAQRAVDCGYDSYYSFGSGEGTFFLQSSGSFDVGPYDGVYGGNAGGFSHQGVTYQGSGAWINTHPSIPPKCVGAAKARSADGKRVAWILVIAQFPANQACPQSSGGSQPGPTATSTTAPVTPSATATVPPTQTATPTPTATPSPTPTASPTPTQPAAPEFRSYVPAIASNP